MSSSPFITPHLLSLPSPSPRKEVPLPQSSYGKVLMEESSCPHLGEKKKTTFKAEHTYSKEKKMKYAQDSYNFSTTLSERNEVQWNARRSLSLAFGVWADQKTDSARTCWGSGCSASHGGLSRPFAPEGPTTKKRDLPC